MNLKISIVIAACLAMTASTARAGRIPVGIEDIPGLAMSGSPLAVMLEGDLRLAEAEKDISLRWTNPSLVWEMEEVGNGDVKAREWVIALEKEFSMPWASSKNRAGTRLRFESARSSYEASRWRLISHLRHGYVTLKIRDAEAAILQNFEEIVADASRVIADRKTEGTVSGIEKRLIDLSLLSMRGKLIEIRAARREMMDEWKTAIGISAADSVLLVSDLDLTTDWLGAGRVTADGSSDLESRRLAAEALKEDIGLEKAGVLPSLSIAGGYKNVEDEFTGFVIGLSFPLPFLNRNSGGIDRATAEFRKAEAELDLYITARDRRISRLLLTAREETALLEQYHGDFARIEKHVADLAASYREGWIDLGDFLQGTQTYADGIEEYFNMLEDYHGVVFELEELTERELFTPGPARKKETGS